MNKNIVLFCLIFGVLFWLVLTPLFLMDMFYLNKKIIYPSRLSYIVDCHPEGIQQGISEIEELGFTVGGAFSEDHIILVDIDETTLRHEVCHFEQFKQGRLKSCDEPIGVFFNEVECYIRENYMDYIKLEDFID